MELAVAILAGLFAGQWLDRHLGTGPWLVIVGVFLGAAAGFYNLVRALTTVDRGRRSPGEPSARPGDEHRG
jgi:F0F1-type ATP synthase assembly protein I